jgi:hypothetical protein
MDLSAVVGLVASEDLEQRRLAGAIRADDADPISCPNHDRSVREEGSVANSLFELGKSQ